MDESLLIDFHNLAFRMFFAKEVGAYTVNPDIYLWRFMVFDSIFKLLTKFDEVKEVIIAVDDKNSWRKSYFNRYKESRKKTRLKQKDVDWELLYKTINNFTADLKHYLPFKVLKVRSSEADDIIAILSKNCKCIISSNDEDYLQLSSDNVKIWNPSKNIFVECNDTSKFLLMKCLTGQAKDDIFNVKTPNEWGLTKETEGKRKPGLGDVTAQKILLEGLDKWLEKNTSVKVNDIVTDYSKNFKRNKILIGFEYIPLTIKNRVIEQYNAYSFPPPENILEFFKKYKMNKFIENFHNVERRLMELY